MRPTVSDPSRAARGKPGCDLGRERNAATQLLVRELRHRIHNLLGVVQCLVTNTEAATADDYRMAVHARIEALSDAHDLIERAHQSRVMLAKLLQLTLRPHAARPGDRLVLAGPDITLEPHVALPLHLIFHELVTNAGKHGALSSRSGSVEVLWDIVPGPCGRALAIQWRERGGPLVRKPANEGFGMRLIAKALPRAQVDLDFAPTGLVCRLLLELDSGSVRGEWVG
ncbi:sensor histidine kinase [Bradyrhizobium ivorense]|uniref:sensor histidine kinase n=1 Tax=Bradyrhizobium ivorense TaxID=2511166 RepID=UPI0010B4C69F|nr:sensor histidine kinase [Bradyrhizobium ivorense]VIO67208.1 Blue-light-activated histidine kinase [Bradyrhizobium ivorense]